MRIFRILIVISLLVQSVQPLLANNNAKKVIAENTLVGIKLYDDVSAVTKKYGSPTEIVPIKCIKQVLGEEKSDSNTEVSAANNTDDEENNFQYSRWIYQKSSSRYSFILNPKGKVILIEAQGLSDGNAKTSKGISLGNSMASLVGKYKFPDTWTKLTSSLMAKYQQKYRVVFGLSKTDDSKTYQVSQIIVTSIPL